jgi:hypothetical protein
MALLLMSTLLYRKSGAWNGVPRNWSYSAILPIQKLVIRWLLHSVTKMWSFQCCWKVTVAHPSSCGRCKFQTCSSIHYAFLFFWKWNWYITYVVMSIRHTFTLGVSVSYCRPYWVNRNSRSNSYAYNMMLSQKVSTKCSCSFLWLAPVQNVHTTLFL